MTDSDVVALVSHAGNDHLEDDNEGAENFDGASWTGGLKDVETAFAYDE